MCLFADFGLGKIMSATCVLGTAAMQAGTPGFKPLEQLKGEAMSIACDIYSLEAGIVERFGGKPIWPNLSSHTIIYKVAVEGQYPAISHLPQEVQQIVERCACTEEKRALAKKILQAVCDLS